MTLLLGLLVIFAVVVDAVHVIRVIDGAWSWIVILEDGGEMLAVSLIFGFDFGAVHERHREFAC